MEEARRELILAAREHLPDVIINFSMAFLIWIFGILVFLPMATGISTELVLICGLILFIGFSIPVLKGFSRLRYLLDPIAGVLAHYLREKWLKIPVDRLRDGLRYILYVIIVVIIYALYLPLLSSIHPSLGGLVLIPMLIWIFWMILRAFARLMK